jgi:hypothetical protein
MKNPAPVRGCEILRGQAARSQRMNSELPPGSASLFIVMAVLTLAWPTLSLAKAQANAKAAAAQTPKQFAPIDLTGYWVSVVTQDWRFRMLTPPKGDFGDVPLNAEGRRVTNNWDPAKDQASGEQCKSYGAPAIMTVPERLHIQWENDNTLRIDTDAGKQTRLLHFAGSPPQAAAPQLQGYSVASWEGVSRPRSDFFANTEVRVVQDQGYLKVITTKMRPGYLRKNGVPYSGDAVLEEDFDRFTEANGDTWLIVTIILTDPQYLARPFVNTIPFKQLADASRWNPEPCEAN